MSTTSTHKPSRLLLWTIILLAVLIRAIILVTAYNYPDRTLSPDSSGYIRPAVVLVTEGGYNDPSAIRTPGYPIFLALIYFLFGQSSFPVVAAQIFLNLLTLFFLYKIALLILPRREAILGTILFSLALESVLTAFFILTETFFAFLVAVITWSLLKYYKSPSWKWAALAGVTTGLAILARPIAILYPLVVILVLLISKTNWRTRLANLAIGLALTAAIVTPWLVRNYNTLGVFSLSTISGRYYLYYQAAFLVSDLQHKPIQQVKDNLKTQVDERMLSANIPEGEVNRSKVETALAREIILAHPLQYAGVHLREDVKGLLPGVAILLNVFGIQEERSNALTVLKSQGVQAALQNYFGDQTWLILLFIPYFIFLGTIYLGGALGVFVLIQRKMWFELTFLLVPILYFLGLPGGSSNARFRVPVMPYLCLLAGLGLVYAWDWLSARRRPALNRTSSEA
jgi:4-amino-4-deoxy-L-arabinose transferase-like glycosyltransferase